MAVRWTIRRVVCIAFASTFTVSACAQEPVEVEVVAGEPSPSDGGTTPSEVTIESVEDAFQRSVDCIRSRDVKVVEAVFDAHEGMDVSIEAETPELLDLAEAVQVACEAEFLDPVLGRWLASSTTSQDELDARVERLRDCLLETGIGSADMTLDQLLEVAEPDAIAGCDRLS